MARLSLVGQRIVIASVLGVAVFANLLPALGQSPGASKQRLIKQIGGYPDVQVAFDNFDGVPLRIETAHVKEIGTLDYHNLTGSVKDSDRYVTFPEVTLTNTTQSRIVSVVLMVGDRPSKKIHGVKLDKAIIEPNGIFSVKSSDWVGPENAVRVTADGAAHRATKPGLDSEKMWWPTSASNVVLRVAQVEFEDGTKWTIDERTGSW